MKDAIGNVQRVVLLGGTSDIALATLAKLAGERRGVQVTLAARPGERRTDAAASLKARGMEVTEVDFEATDRTSYEHAIASAFDARGDVDVAMVAFGLLGDQERAWQDLDAALELVQVNYTAAVACGVLVATRMRAQGHGAIIAMSSVAGERPRKSNFAYGSTKAGMDAFGLLGDQERAWQDLDAALELVQVNYTAAVACGVLVATRMRAQGHGAIIAMSSVAGERPRTSNFAYGSTKAGMDTFYSGLGDAIARDGVQVLVVRPGFVRSTMTAGLAAAPLSQTPEQVAEVIVAGLAAGRHTVWAPSHLRWVMSALRHLPRAVFRRLPI